MSSTATNTMLLDASQIAAVSRLFSSSVVREIARRGKSPLFARLFAESTLKDLVSLTDPLSRLFDVAFALLKRRSYRHEYVYKAAIVHKILLGQHSLRTAVMLPEFRVGDRKADVVILNGTSTVYEIKSERDNLNRLQSQVEAYRQVFARVNVIAGQNHIEDVLANVAADVGILLLTDRFQISTIREAVDSPERVVPEIVFDSIRLSESRRILESLGVSCPTVANTQAHPALRARFIRLGAREVHDGMVQVLRSTRNMLPLAELVEALPQSLHAAALSTPLRQRDYGRLSIAMNAPLGEALNWK